MSEFIPTAGFDFYGKSQYWCQNNGILPFCVVGVDNRSPLSRYLEVQIREDGNWSFGLFLREPAENKHNLALLPSQEVLSSYSLVSYLIRPGFQSFKDLEWRIINEIVSVYEKNGEVQENLRDHTTSGGTLWKSRLSEHLYLRRYFGGGFRLSVPDYSFVNLFVENLEVEKYCNALEDSSARL